MKIALQNCNKRGIQLSNCCFAFSTDKNFIVPTYIAIHSLMHYADRESMYKVYMLTPSNLPSEHIGLIKSLEQIYDNLEIEIVNMGDAFKDSKLVIGHTPIASMYRLVLSELLPDCDRCIYMDGDVIVCDDMSELFSLDMDGYYIGAVRDIEAGQYMAQFDYNSSKPDPEGYVNSGFLVMNLKKIREDNLVSRFLELSKERFLFGDQDVINIACKDKILYLDLKYNALVKYRFLSFKEKNYADFITKYFSVKEIHEAIDKPVVIHYAQPLKPWHTPYNYKGNYWYDYINKYIGKDVRDSWIKDYINEKRCDTKTYYKTLFHRILYKAGILRIILKAKHAI
ncbi:glycosyltransferase family 8 protein [Butyrivibrio sp.]|uniref:glycosyltransferase family 8 protein n=1 Tax=Butyrivibrio sp. TaxID=28121 RepID=UPI0025BF49B3|nr:glycosyltransferase family 8 protein [Butyrivibrio sp.]